MNSKIVKIILILLFAGSSFLIGFLVGQTYSGMSNEVALNNQAIKDKETLLNEVEENLQKYIVMPEVPDQILGEILKIDKGNLSIGTDADLCIVDIDKPWIVKKEKLVSKSKNTSIEDKKLQGIVTNTFVKGKELFKL